MSRPRKYLGDIEIQRHKANRLERTAAEMKKKYLTPARKAQIARRESEYWRGPGVAVCIACGNRLSYCGKPFTAEIACLSCGAVNVYEESRQPVRVKCPPRERK